MFRYDHYRTGHTPKENDRNDVVEYLLRTLDQKNRYKINRWDRATYGPDGKIARDENGRAVMETSYKLELAGSSTSVRSNQYARITPDVGEVLWNAWRKPDYEYDPISVTYGAKWILKTLGVKNVNQLVQQRKDREEKERLERLRASTTEYLQKANATGLQGYGNHVNETRQLLKKAIEAFDDTPVVLERAHVALNALNHLLEMFQGEEEGV